MNNLEFDEYFFIPTTQEQINELEKNIWHIFPEDYKSFLLNKNGWTLKNDRPLINHEKWVETINFFLWIRWEEEWYDLFYDNFCLRKWRYPKWFISKWDDPGWNAFLLNCDLSSPKYWNLYFWDHENESQTDEPWMENIYFIANNFNDFLDKIYFEK